MSGMESIDVGESEPDLSSRVGGRLLISAVVGVECGLLKSPVLSRINEESTMTSQVFMEWLKIQVFPEIRA
jgi:hypothetical protein